MTPFARTLAFCLLGFATSGAAASETPAPPPGAWPAVAPEARAGFGALLIITDDENWFDEWNQPHEYVPHFRTTDRVASGARLHIIAAFHSPSPGPDGRADVRCDFRMRRPGGEVSLDMRDVPCFQHPVAGNARSTFIVDQTLVFVADDTEPVGEHHVEITLRDVVAGAHVDLSATFHRDAP